MRCWIIRCPMAILAVAVAAWAGSSLSADVSGGYRPLDQKTMESARGSNPYFDDKTWSSDDCSTVSVAKLSNQIGSLWCVKKDDRHNPIFFRRACVNCSSDIPAWPIAFAESTPNAKKPIQAATAPTELNQPCGLKTVGRCDKEGECINAHPVEGQESCANVTPNVYQAISTTP